jgi:hypothetical protein
MSAYFCPDCLDMCHEALEFDHCCMICASPEEARALGWPVVDEEHGLPRLPPDAGPPPVLCPTCLDEICQRCLQCECDGGCCCPADPDLTITTTDAADEAYADVVSAGVHDGKTRPGIEPTTGEIFEHVHEGERCWCLPWKPAPLPQAVVDELGGHQSVDACIESMFTRAEADQVRALTNGNGQVSHGA